MLSSCKDIARRLFGHLFSFLKIDKKLIVFDNFNGGGFGCNPKYIAQELLQSDLRLVWLSSEKTQEVSPEIKFVKNDSIRAWFYLSIAKVYISNVRNDKKIKKRTGQFYLQTWHASLGPKKIEADAEDTLSPEYVAQAKLNGKNTDLMIANNAFMAEVFKESFWYEGPVAKCGIPRNKLLLVDDKNAKRAIRASVGVRNGVKICLYAPTWRSEGREDALLFDFEGCLKALEHKYRNPFVMLLRFHPNTSIDLCSIVGEKVKNVTDYPDVQELLSVADFLISDYSSIVEDYALKGGPGLMYAPDYEDYKKKKGFYYRIEERPFPVCRTFPEMEEAIRSMDPFLQEQKAKDFCRKFRLEDDGNGSSILAKLIEEITCSNDECAMGIVRKMELW